MDRDGWTCTLPSPPALTDPGTNDTDGNYTVSWSSVSSATNYTLEEDTSSSFSSPTTVYSGSETSKEITGKSDGTYYYRVMACNECGCSDWSNIENINIDTIPPTVNISYPPNEQTFGTTNITVKGNASDNVGVSKVEVKVGSESWQTASGTISWSKPVTLETGPNTINARATDTSGNTNQTLVTVICDITPPVIYHEPITTATEGENISIFATITDDTKVASATLFYRITGGEAWTSTPMIPIGNIYSETIPASNVTTAGVQYYIEAVDDVLNTAKKPATAPTTPYSITVIMIDTIQPTVNITYPINEQTFGTTNITVNGNASDNVAVGKVEVKWNRSVTLVPGSNTIYARATDTAGNIKNTSVTVFCDITPPDIYHENITTANEGESIPISATITDDTEVASATLFYRITSEGAWITTPMEHVGDNYSATIPASNVTTAGVEYYIKAVDGVLNTANKPATAPKKSYPITIKVNVGYAIIIAGRNDSLMQSCYDHTANGVYKILSSPACGFTEDSIFYLNPSKLHDADSDGNYDVDSISSRTNITDAISLSWAQKNVSANDPLLIYMVGHCNKSGEFFLNGTNNTLTASYMNNSLNNLTTKKECDHITVVCEACNSGSFIDNLSRCGRIIVTSTGVNADSINHVEMGGVFSYNFFNSISDGKTIKAAFEKASNYFIDLNFSDITPLLDDNGDGNGSAIPLNNSEDGSWAACRYICTQGNCSGTQGNDHSYNSLIPAIRLEGCDCNG
jgi:hypothetical protein